VWAGYLSPRLNSEIPEGIPNTKNTQTICKRRWASFTYSLMLSHILLRFYWSGPSSMSVEGIFLSFNDTSLVIKPWAVYSHCLAQDPSLH